MSNESKNWTTRQLTAVALMAAVMCVLGPMSVPIGAVPISLTNMVVCFAVWLLGPQYGALSVLVYLMLGAVGMPVFSGFAGGLAKLTGPTGGYLIGYLPMSMLAGWIMVRAKEQPVISALGLVLGTAVCYTMGTAWFVLQMGCTLSHALTVCVYPFIVIDLAKIVFTAVVGTVVKKRLREAKLLQL